MTNKEKKIILDHISHFAWEYQVRLGDPEIDLVKMDLTDLQEICSWGSISIKNIGDQKVSIVFGGDVVIDVDINDIEVSDPRNCENDLPEYIQVRLGDLVLSAYESAPDEINRKVDYELMEELIRELNSLSPA